MNRRELLRYTIAGVGAGAAAPAPANAREFPANYDVSRELARQDWKPTFLDPHQNETLIVLSELVIPTTDTPGAKEALANRFIDAIMSVEPAEVQREFLNALARLDGECMDRYRTAFVHATREQQTELLSYLAAPQSLGTWESSVRGEETAHRQFLALKDWISRAYYSSEIGMRELGYDGRPLHGVYQGCTHGPNAVDHIEPKVPQHRPH